MVSRRPRDKNGRMPQITQRRVPDTLPSVRSFQREPDAAVLSGLCGGIAARSGVDVLLVRALAVLLGISAGFGVILYAGLSMMSPAKGTDDAPLDKYWPEWRRFSDKTLGLGLLALSLTFAIIFGKASPFGWLPAVILFVGWRMAARVDRKQFEAAQRARHPQPLPPGVVWAPPAAATANPTPQPGTLMPQPVAQWQVYGQPNVALAPTLIDRPTAQGSTALTTDQHKVVKTRKWTKRVLVWGTLLGATTAWSIAGSFGGELLAYSAALLVVALGLLIGAKLGRSILLILAGIGLSIGLVTATPQMDQLRLAGQANYPFASAADLPDVLDVTATKAAIDLSTLELDDSQQLTIQATAAEVTIMAPDPTKVRLVVEADSQAGSVTLPDSYHSGFETVTWESGVASQLPTLTIAVEAVASSIEVKQS